MEMRGLRWPEVWTQFVSLDAFRWRGRILIYRVVDGRISLKMYNRSSIGSLSKQVNSLRSADSVDAPRARLWDIGSAASSETANVPKFERFCVSLFHDKGARRLLRLEFEKLRLGTSGVQRRGGGSEVVPSSFSGLRSMILCSSKLLGETS